MILFVCLSHILFMVQAEPVSIRLVGGSDSHEGRVEVFHNGSWGTVCDDNWDNSDAKVVCRQLGYGDGTAKGGAIFGAGSGQIWLYNVACLGNESVLTNCPANPWGVNNCGHDEDAGVVCSCTLGTFGSNCNPNCGTCACNSLTGDCSSCQPGYRGNRCIDACSKSTYGDNCSSLCGHCNGTCNHIDGICPRDCLPGWQGLNCSEECEDGFYGYNCSQVCGHCNGPCNHISGICTLKCLSGWKGSMCNKDEPLLTIVIITVSIIFSITIILAIICILIKKRHRIIDLTKRFSRRDQTQPIDNENDQREMPETKSKTNYYDDYEVPRSTVIPIDQGNGILSNVVKLPVATTNKGVKRKKVEKKKKKNKQADNNLEINEQKPSDGETHIYDKVDYLSLIY